MTNAPTALPDPFAGLKLKPCPFCVTAPKWQTVPALGHDEFQIYCDTPGSEAHDVMAAGETPQEAAERWNNRPTMPPLQAASARVQVGSDVYMRDGRGALVPIEKVKAADLLVDETVRKVLGYAVDISDQVGRFRQHTLDDILNLQALLEQEYGVTSRGVKGNLSYTSYDDCLQVRLQVAELVTFGPELQAAKALIDECLMGWAEGTAAELRALITDAFDVQQEGKVRPAAMWRLLRLDITDPRWVEAMRAIKDSVRPRGSKQYVRFYRRDDPTKPWEAVKVDVAAA